jgi:hypothetical protein
MKMTLEVLRRFLNHGPRVAPLLKPLAALVPTMCLRPVSGRYGSNWCNNIGKPIPCWHWAWLQAMPAHRTGYVSMRRGLFAAPTMMAARFPLIGSSVGIAYWPPVGSGML